MTNKPQTKTTPSPEGVVDSIKRHDKLDFDIERESMTTYGVNINDRFKYNESIIKAHAAQNIEVESIPLRRKLARWHLVSLAIEDWVNDIKVRPKDPVEMVQGMVRGYVDMIYVMDNPQKSTIIIEDETVDKGITRIYTYLLKYKAGKWKIPIIKINGKPNLRMVIWLAVERYARKLEGSYFSLPSDQLKNS